MGSIAFAAPGIDRYHLHERLARELQAHGHVVTALCVDPVAHTFWRHQPMDCAFVAEGRDDAMQAPLDEFAQRECQRLGPPPSPRAARRRHRRCRQRLARLLPNLLRWFEAERPGLLLLHQQRTAAHALLQFVARETGTRVLWTGVGLLPHTLQVDETGLDGDAAAIRRHAGDYRVVRNEPALLAACLAHALARATPSALTRREVQRPPLHARFADLVPAFRRHGARGAAWALRGWRQALPDGPDPLEPAFTLPAQPFTTVLLQDPDDDRVRLDAHAPPSQRELILAAATATAGLDRRLALVVVLPPRGLDHCARRDLTTPVALHFAPAHAAAAAAAAGVAVCTINHPLASVALLAGTPVVHTGRALYGLPGAATPTTTADLAAALARALARDHATLRQRFLSWLFGHGHVWCSATSPDHNGLAGLVQTIAARLDSRRAVGLRLRYRPGPAWPLALDPPRPGG